MPNPTDSDILTPAPSDFELTLRQVDGLYASRVVLDQNNAVSEVHVVASTARKPKQIVRDIETLLFVKHGTRIDYRKVSMVQLADEQLLRVPLARMEIRRVVEEDLGTEKRIRVEIKGAGRTVEGEARERVDNPSIFRTAAKATIQAIDKLVGQKLDARLDHAETLRLDLHEVIIVIVTCFTDKGEEKFVGSSFIGNRPAESAARATLDALNRRVFSLGV
jgi:hypothetical protein